LVAGGAKCSLREGTPGAADSRPRGMTGEKKYPQRELRVFSFIAIPDVTVFAFAVGGEGYSSPSVRKSQKSARSAEVREIE
jgi:hypothetical protein